MTGVRIQVKSRGPLVIEGAFELVGPDGEPLPLPPTKRVLLCRCGASSTRPLCDGSHNRIGFEAPPPTDEETDEVG